MASKTTTKEDTTYTILQSETPAEVLAFLRGAHVEQVDASKASLDIIASILAAETFEDITAESNVTHSRDVVDMPLTVTGLKWLESSYAPANSAEDLAKLSFYCLFDAVTSDKRKILVTCGSGPVMAALFNLASKGMLSDNRVKVIEKDTASGFKVMRLVAAD